MSASLESESSVSTKEKEDINMERERERQREQGETRKHNESMRYEKWYTGFKIPTCGVAGTRSEASPASYGIEFETKNRI
jgi:hypothetical protein